MAAAGAYFSTTVPRIAVTFPLALPLPDGFDPDDASTWPAVEGRLEYVKGRLEFMPPCGETQQTVAVDVVTELNLWCRANPGFVAAGTEAGMKLDGDVRGADGAIFQKTTTPLTHRFRRSAPLLAVEVAGEDDTIEILREKAAWYLAHGVTTVWIIDADAREAHVITGAGTVTVRDRMPEPTSLPGLTPLVADFFRQL